MGEFIERARRLNQAHTAETQRRVGNMALELVGDITLAMVAAMSEGGDQAFITRKAYASDEDTVRAAMADATARLRLEDPDLHIVHHNPQARCGLSTATHYLGIGWNGEPKQTIRLGYGLELVSHLPEAGGPNRQD